MTIKHYIAATATALIIISGTFSVANAHGHAKSHHVSKKMKKADIVDTAVNAGAFNTLIAAVQAAGLEGTLRSDGPFTVFAPTDEAFAKLPAGTVESLLQPENKDKLVSILTYHVLPGKVKAKDIAEQKLVVETVQGTNIFVDGRDGVKIDNANVIKADIKTSNGIIHVIDNVIIP